MRRSIGGKSGHKSLRQSSHDAQLSPIHDATSVGFCSTPARANGGIAGEVSANGLGPVWDYLDLFPNARYFVVGYGTNDLGMEPEVEQTSPMIIENLDGMVRAIREDRRLPILLNVPSANESMFPRSVAEDLHRMRDYHNERLAEHCQENQIPLVDIASKLRDEHLADELHPNEQGAQVIATEVFLLLSEVQELDGLG